MFLTNTHVIVKLSSGTWTMFHYVGLNMLCRQHCITQLHSLVLNNINYQPEVSNMEILPSLHFPFAYTESFYLRAQTCINTLVGFMTTCHVNRSVGFYHEYYRMAVLSQTALQPFSFSSPVFLQLPLIAFFMVEILSIDPQNK